MPNIDRRFTDRIQRLLGAPDSIELSPTGRTLMRYPQCVVSPEGGSMAVAARRTDQGMRFAIVRKGRLDWRPRRPTRSTRHA